MYMKTNYLLFGILAVLVWACSSDDNDNTPSGFTVETVSQAPSWQVDWTGNESRPEWQEPESNNYENWATLLLQVEDELNVLLPFDYVPNYCELCYDVQ